MIRRITGAIALVFSALALAQDLPAETADKLAELDVLAPVLLAKYDVHSVGVAYIEDGEIAFVRHYGYQTWGFPANEQTLYNVTSLTKPVTAEIVMRLVEAGRLSLDAPLADYHVEKDVADDPRVAALTARVVMRHRTGFPNWRYETEGTLRFLRDPDTETGYSGEGYEWMMLAAEKAAGQDWEQLADTLLFEPAGM